MIQHVVRIRLGLQHLAVATGSLLVAAALASRAPGTLPRPRLRRDERAQSTVEYALILLGAAAIALVVVAWVTRSDAIGRLFDTVIGRVLQQAE